jgi:rhodanese-related sulfurtransferase
MVVSADLTELSPAAVEKALREQSIVLIDVRESPEYAAERIQGAHLFPLSTFDPGALPSPEGRKIVFHCGSGKRSAMAVGKCLERGITHTAHMAGGILAWKAAGLPTIILAPASRVVLRDADQTI